MDEGKEKNIWVKQLQVQFIGYYYVIYQDNNKKTNTRLTVQAISGHQNDKFQVDMFFYQQR